MSNSIQEERAAMRAKEFKRGIDADDARARRGDNQLQLRKNKREENLRKRRNRLTPAGTEQQNAQQQPSQLRNAAQHVQNLSSPDPAVVESAVVFFRKQLSLEKNPPIREVIEMGIVPRLVQLLTVPSQHSSIIYESAWALTNIASGTSDETAVVVNAGALPIFVQLLQVQFPTLFSSLYPRNPTSGSPSGPSDPETGFFFFDFF